MAKRDRPPMVGSTALGGELLEQKGEQLNLPEHESCLPVVETKVDRLPRESKADELTP